MLVNVAFVIGLILLVAPDFLFYPPFSNTLRYWLNVGETGSDAILFSTVFYFLRREIGNRRAANEQLAVANRQKTEFLQIASHDLRNPLNAIVLLASELPPGKPDSDGDRHDSGKKISSLAFEMLGMIEELIDAAALGDGTLKLNRAPVDLTSCVSEVVERNRSQANRKSQQIHLSMCDPVKVEGDSARIKQTLDNLISNAVKFSPLGESIFVTVHSEGQHAQIEVVDHGPGLSDEDKTKLFRRFQRLTARPTGGESSMGLGLANTRLLVELIGGKIGAESEGLGRGSRFWIELPVAA